MNSLFADTEMGATFSPCNTYRYRLWRYWGPGQRVAWIMLNPSTADASTNDPTIERCQRRAEQWGYDGIEVVNLFAYRATDPRDMMIATDSVGPDNDAAIMEAVTAASLVMAAWGRRGTHLGRSAAVRKMVGVLLHCLRVSKGGEPAHPLYLSYDLKPVPLETVP